MNILLVVTGWPSKKTPARSVFNKIYCEALSKAGHTVSVLYLRSLSPSRSFINNYQVNDVNVIELSIVFPRLFFRYAYLVKFLLNRIINHRPLNSMFNSVEVIHAVGGGSVEAAYHIGRKFNKPLISQFIGSDINIHFPSLLKNRWFVKGIEYSYKICFNSKSLAHSFQKQYGEKSNCDVLYRGISLDKYSFEFNNSQTIKFLFLGGFPKGNSDLKGGVTLLNCLKLLIQLDLPCSCTFYIGGVNSGDYLEENNFKKNPNIVVQFIGAVEREEVVDLMKASHVVLVPSSNEGLPNVIFEAMSMGNMVVASNVGGIPEVVEDGKTGRLIDPNDPQKLAEIILEVAHGCKEIRRFALEGRSRVEAFDYNNFLKCYVNHYKKAVSQNAKTND